VKVKVKSQNAGKTRGVVLTACKAPIMLVGKQRKTYSRNGQSPQIIRRCQSPRGDLDLHNQLCMVFRPRLLNFSIEPSIHDDPSLHHIQSYFLDRIQYRIAMGHTC
jgi:hypothetical protein